MPYYEYECKKCNHCFSVAKPMRMSDAKEECPLCNHIATKLIGKPGFILKGDGFHVNDYKNNDGN